jgi:hypothetical protein
MPLVSDAQLDSLRLIAYQGLDTDVTIERLTRVEGPYGTDETRAVVGTTKGWLRAMNRPEIGLHAGQAQALTVYRLGLAVGTDIREEDRVVIEGETYIVQDVFRENTIQVFLKCVLRKAD